MRTLTATLTAKQKERSYYPLIAAALTQGATSYTFEQDRLFLSTHEEQPYSQKAEIVLKNADGYLTDLDLKGYKVVLSYGMRTSAGEEVSACAPLWVMGQQLVSQEGNLHCIITAAGLMDIMAEERASESYIPTSSDTKTVKTLINEIMGATLTCYSHCLAITVDWDSEDSLIDSYQPKDSFRIYTGGSRLAALRRLLDYTKCVARIEDDGHLHIFQPTISGTSYDYEYALYSTNHVFFSKAYRKTLVLPNYVVVKSNDDDSPQYSGYSSDAESIAAFRQIRQYEQTRLASNDQAEDIAEAILSKYQLHSQAGSAEVPMNCGAEVFDYIKVTDAREGDYRIGNIGTLTRKWTASRQTFTMSFSFGGWLTVRGLMSNLEVYPSGIGSAGSVINRLNLKNLEVEHIQAGSLDITLDDVVDGSVYAKIKGLHLTGGQIKLDNQVYYAAGYNPTEKELQVERGASPPADTNKLWIDTTTTPSQIKRYSGGSWVVCTPKDLDDLPNGSSYSRVASASLNASGLILLDQVVAGTYGLVLSADISAGHIKLDTIEDGSTYKKVLATQISSNKIYLSSSCLYAAGYDPSGKRRVFTSTPTTPYDLGDMWFAAGVAKRCTTARASGAYVSGDWTPLTVDDLTDGSSYGRVAITDITSGHVKLSECYGTLDDIDNGVTYGKLNVADISSGHIKLTSYTVVDGQWYDSSGVEIDSTHGINIYGTANALTTRATKTGTIQCYVGADGAIYAGAGAVKLYSAGAVFDNSVSEGAILIKRGTPTMQLYLNSSYDFFLNLYGSGAGHIYLSPGSSKDVFFYNGLRGIVGDYDPFVRAYSLQLNEIASGPSPGAAIGSLYTKSDNKLYFKDGDATEHEVAFV